MCVQQRGLAVKMTECRCFYHTGIKTTQILRVPRTSWLEPTDLSVVKGPVPWKSSLNFIELPFLYPPAGRLKSRFRNVSCPFIAISATCTVYWTNFHRLILVFCRQSTRTEVGVSGLFNRIYSHHYDVERVLYGEWPCLSSGKSSVLGTLSFGERS